MSFSNIVVILSYIVLDKILEIYIKRYPKKYWLKALSFTNLILFAHYTQYVGF